MDEGIGRREFVAAVGALGLAAASPALLGGCGAPDDDDLARRIVASLRECVGDVGGAGHVSKQAGLDAEAALSLLRGDQSATVLHALTWNPRLMRSYVAKRRDGDFAAGRTLLVEGWLISETELAVAVLVGI